MDSEHDSYEGSFRENSTNLDLFLEAYTIHRMSEREVCENHGCVCGNLLGVSKMLRCLIIHFQVVAL